VAAGIPVLRVNLRGGTCIRNFSARLRLVAYQCADPGIISRMRSLMIDPPAQNPVMRVGNGEILRRRLEGPERDGISSCTI